MLLKSLLVFSLLLSVALHKSMAQTSPQADLIRQLECPESENVVYSRKLFVQEDSVLQYIIYLKGIERLLELGLDVTYTDTIKCLAGVMSIGNDSFTRKRDSICIQSRLHDAYNKLLKNYIPFFKAHKSHIQKFKAEILKYYYLQNEEEVLAILQHYETN